MELPGSLWGQYVEDSFFRKIFAAPDQFSYFKYVDGLLYKLTEEGVYLLCILDIMIGS